MSSKKAVQPKKDKSGSKPDAKKKIGGGRAGDAVDEDRRDQKLQAILLADSFTTTFRPITLECPKVLLPLVNVPMIDYTLEFLAQNGVEEVVVFCCWLADKLEAYLKTSRWNSIISIRIVSSSTCSSAGDALRELDGLNIIRSDPFVLISGDVIANVDLKKAIAFHKQKRKADPNNIMTLALKKVQRCGGSKPLDDDLVVGTLRHSSQVVIFEDSIDRSSVSIPIDLLESNVEIELSADLLDCNVDVCSPELLLQFSDNFDYQDIRRDFIRNEVCNHSLGKHIYGYVIENEYAARVQDPRTYHVISRDIVTRWTYPLVPDIPLLRDGHCTQSKRYVYRDASVKIARTVNILEEVVIGKGSSIGDASFIARAILGEFVSIGKSTSVINAHLWKGVIVGNSVKIDGAILCDGVVVEDNCVIPHGCVLSYGVRLAKGSVLEPFTRMTKEGLFVGDDDPERNQKFHSIGAADNWKKSMWYTPSVPIDEDSDNDDDESHEQDFQKIVSDMVICAIFEGQPVDSVLMEIKGFKFAQNKSFGDCLKGIFCGIGSSICNKLQNINVSSFARELRSITQVNAIGHQLLGAMTHDRGDEVELILGMEEFLMNIDVASKLPSGLRFCLQTLYDTELIGEEAIFQWESLRRSGEDCAPERLQLFSDLKVQEFLEWLASNDDEDSEDDESSTD